MELKPKISIPGPVPLMCCGFIGCGGRGKPR